MDIAVNMYFYMLYQRKNDSKSMCVCTYYYQFDKVPKHKIEISGVFYQYIYSMQDYHIFDFMRLLH